MIDLLSTHTITATHGERLESLLIVLVESHVVSRIYWGHESLWVENTRFDPLVRIVLDVL